MAAGLPVASTKRHTASTFGPIDPAGKERARSPAGVARRTGRACGVPYPSMTAATSVSSSSASACSSRASSEAVRSLSTTASTPEAAPAVGHDGYPAAAGADHDGPGAEQGPDGGQVEQLGGFG